MLCRCFRTIGVVALFLVSAVTAERGFAQAQPPQPPTGPATVRPAPPRTGPSTGTTPRTAMPRAASARPGVSGVPAGARPSSIQGAAWQSDNGPVPRAVLRLRNVVTGALQDTTVASDAGTFAFNGVPDGTYVIEMVAESGKIIMVGQTFTVAPGETVATFVRLGPKIPWFNGFFNNAAAAVSSSAASTGITAIAPEAIPPVSAAR